MRPIDGDRMRYLEATAREIGAALGRAIKRPGLEGCGFTLLLFSYEGSEITYISSAEREGMKKTMRELLAKWDAGEADTTWAERS
jgi:hypothetical protein